MESTFQKISRKTGRKPSECKCNLCKKQCTSVGLGTPEDIMKLIVSGYASRLMRTNWGAGMRMGVINKPVEIIAPVYDKEKGACTFFTDGLCELHELGLKPTECRLSHHSLRVDNFNAKKSLAWAVVKEWINLTTESAGEMIDKCLQTQPVIENSK